jgi:hypothetical protein
MVALVVAGAAEDRARAVFHQHEVGGIDRHGLAGDQRVLRQQRQLVALLLGGLDLGRRGAGLAAFGDEVLQAGIARGEALDQRVLGRQRHERRAEQRVGPGGEDLQLAVIRTRGVGELPEDARPAALADPVRLHQAHLLGPAVERIQALSSSSAKCVILRFHWVSLRLLDRCARAPALALDHLLVGQHVLSTGSQLTQASLR